jgi:molybdopterin molybdotransferase
MPEFLKLQPPFIALHNFLSAIPESQPETEEIKTIDGLTRVLARNFYAPNPLPEFPRSTVDGYAVVAAHTHGSSESIPAILKMIGEVPMGKSPSMAVGEGQAILIHTGGMIPTGADAVVMLENCQLNNGSDLEVFKPVSVNENVILVGEDVSKGDLVIPAGRVIRPVEIGGLMSFGITRMMR